MVVVAVLAIAGALGPLVISCAGEPAHREDDEAQGVWEFEGEPQESLVASAGRAIIHSTEENDTKYRRLAAFYLGEYVENPAMWRVPLDRMEAFKEELAKLLDDEDDVMRAFAATILGAIGDGSYARRIAAVMEKPPGTSVFSGERQAAAAAAMALGLLGAREYVSTLVSLLQSDSPAMRAGGALGLAYLGAREHAPAIARLLEDPEVKGIAVYSLAELDAVEFAEPIAALLNPENRAEYELIDEAIFALARLEATEYAPEFARFLERGIHAGKAAKALALLKATEYADRIAELLEAATYASRRTDFLIALGILGSKRHAPEVAQYLRETENHSFQIQLQQHAAVCALILMDAVLHQGILGAVPGLSFSQNLG
jgi:HEAT repeat protein